MGLKELVVILDEILKTEGFKKKGHNWLYGNEEITKMVQLQKSNFSNRCYINYGYIINSLPLGDLNMHLFMGLGSLDIRENERIKELLDLDNGLTDDTRHRELKLLFHNNLLRKIKPINTLIDIKNEVLDNKGKTLIPLVIKKYFELE